MGNELSICFADIIVIQQPDKTLKSTPICAKFPMDKCHPNSDILILFSCLILIFL